MKTIPLICRIVLFKRNVFHYNSLKKESGVVTMDQETTTKNQVSYVFSRDVILKELLENGVITEWDYQRYDQILYDRYHIDGQLKLVRPVVKEVVPENVQAVVGKADYVSLTSIAREKDAEAAGYLIQSWLRDSNVIQLLRLWERRNNPEFDDIRCTALCEAVKKPATTLTVKKWIEETNAIGLISKQGANGGTYGHPEIGCAFRMWLYPEFQMEMILNYMQPTDGEERDDL